jgi:hypothetical protein
MSKLDDLKAEYEELKAQLAAINTRVLAIINRNNKAYTYSNVESVHKAETHSLDELRNMKRDIKEQMTSIEYQIYGPLVQFKRC